MATLLCRHCLPLLHPRSHMLLSFHCPGEPQLQHNQQPLAALAPRPECTLQLLSLSHQPLLQVQHLVLPLLQLLLLLLLLPLVRAGQRPLPCTQRRRSWSLGGLRLCQRQRPLPLLRLPRQAELRHLHLRRRLRVPLPMHPQPRQPRLAS